MKKSQDKFVIENKIWLWSFDGTSAWHFVTLPPEVSLKIKKANLEKNGKLKRGFGSIKVKVKIGETSFETSIFPNAKDKTYLLPIKKEVRRNEGLQEGDVVKFEIKII